MTAPRERAHCTGMKNYSISEDPGILAYVEELFGAEDALLGEIRARAAKAGLPAIHVAASDGAHLEVLVRACGARKAVEIGTLAGYSGTCIARSMPEQSRLYTFEFEPKHAEVARESFKRAGLEAKVEVFVGPALEQLRRIEAMGPFDLVFVDADKVSYPAYAQWAADHLRVGGLLIGDNTFAWGMIGDEKFESAEDRASVLALREFNRIALRGGRFRGTLLPTGEGLTVAVKIR